MLCVTSTIVYLLLRARMSSSILAVATGSIAEQGSSMSSTSGSAAIARAMQVEDAVVGADVRRLAAARWADYSGHAVLLDLDGVAEERLLLPVEEVEVAHRDLAGQLAEVLGHAAPLLGDLEPGRDHRRLALHLCRFVHCRPYHSLPLWKRSLTRMFMPSTAMMMTSAPPQASSCQCGYGEPEKS